VYGPEITTCCYKGLLKEYVRFCYGSRNTAPLAVLRFSAHSGTFCTMWFRLFTQNVIKTGHTDRSHPHSTEHDTQPIAYLISKQVIPYRTRGGTYCPGVSTPKIRSLAESSPTSHITWQNPTVSTIPTLLIPQHRSSPWSNHISMDGRSSLTKTSSTQHHKGWKDLYDTHDCLAKHN
jgi:hypothetical protein